MKPGLYGRCAAALPWLLAGTLAAAEPLGLIDRDGGYVDIFSVGIISGADLRSTRSIVATGTPIVGPPESVLADKSYTALVGQLGNADDRHESYLEQPTLIGLQLASAVVNAAGDLEVGVDGFQDGASRALSRFALTIKNYRSRPVTLDFAFAIPAGEVLVYDPAQQPAEDPRAVEAGVWARIDALLRTPAGAHGGHYDDTEHRLFDFHVGLLGASDYVCMIRPCDAQFLEYTSNASALLERRARPPGQSIFGFDIAASEWMVRLPEIAPYGELTLYYDMLARVNGANESGGRAALGDPFDLMERGGSVQLVERFANAVPVPGTAWLVALSAVALLLRRRRGA